MIMTMTAPYFLGNKSIWTLPARAIGAFRHNTKLLCLISTYVEVYLIQLSVINSISCL
jgi:hypothetical protein